MNNFEFNKILASILVAVICMKVFQIIADGLVQPVYLHQNILGINVGAEAIAASNAAKSLDPISPLLATASVVNGKKVAKKCLQCHSFEKGGPHRTGPNLWGIVMNAVANIAGYVYSHELKAHGGIWDYESLSTYLNKPREYIKGTKMYFVGISSAQEMADLIAYMRTQSDNLAPLP